ncbi:MAG: Holliday junction branch migration protein RuvA [Ruminococcus sp.]|nr:Holliday junction branch migration protein RuvA [Ruminococcus sp.]
MFYSLTGNVIFSDLSSVAIECSGVGFRCLTSANTMRDIDKTKKITLYTYLNVREDALDLFGFSTEYELEWFKLLIGVTGVGPKAALAILSELTPEKLALCISAGDVKAITRAQGVGPKIAQRVILELKNKAKSAVTAFDSGSDMLDSVAAVNDAPNTSEAIAALTMLGYTQSEASVAVSKVDPTLSVEEIIRQGLKILSRQV